MRISARARAFLHISIFIAHTGVPSLFLFRLPQLGLIFVFETIAALWLGYVVPYHWGFRNNLQHPTVFEWSYIISYIADAVLCVCAIISALRQRKKRAEKGARHRPLSISASFAGSNPGASFANKILEVISAYWPFFWNLVFSLPVDVFFWGAPSTRSYVTWIRLVRLFPTTRTLLSALTAIDRSPSVNFSNARTLRIIFLAAYTSHVLCCLFWFVANTEEAIHFAAAPWLDLDPTSPANTFITNTTEIVWNHDYLRTVYWSLMTLTTVGHIDKLKDGKGEWWEVVIALVVVVGCTVVYTYITANITAMMLRFYQQLERYRSRVQRVDNYLRRNHVRSRLRKLVREHFRRLYDNELNGNDSMLSEMPLSLRREVSKDIMMPILRQAPIFYGVDYALLCLLCGAMQRASFLSQEFISKQGDVVTELYLLESGTVLYTMEVEGDDSDEDDDSDADGGNASGDDDDEEDVSKTHLSDDDESKTGSKISDDDGSPMILRPSMQTVARASLLAVGTLIQARHQAHHSRALLCLTAFGRRAVGSTRRNFSRA